MAQDLIHVNLPIRLQCLRVPVKWKYEIVRTNDGRETVWFGAAGGRSEPASAFDPREKRAEFFRLKDTDYEGLREFLDGVGLFRSASIDSALFAAETADVKEIEKMQDNYRHVNAADGSHKVWGDPIPLDLDVFWTMRRTVIRELEEPKKGVGFDVWPLSIRLANLRSGPAAVITTLTFEDALAASVRIDHLLGAKIRKCERQDCPVTFSAPATKENKIFCSWYCGHITSVRKKRDKDRKAKGRKKQGERNEHL